MFDIRRLRHDHGGGCPKLQRELLDSCDSGDPVSHGSGASEGDLIHPLVCDELFAQACPWAIEEPQYARWQPRIEEALRQGDSGEGGGECWLEDDSISRGQGGTYFVQHEEGGVVERRNRDHNTDGLSKSETDLVKTGTRVGIQGKRIAIPVGAFECREPDDFSRS